MKNLILTKTIDIDAPASEIWDALTNPATIKQWLYGTDAISEWKTGSPIAFTGRWNGTEYTDKGIILNLESGKSLKYTYWSSFSGLPDVPENYSIISFEISPKEKQTKLTLTQMNFKDETPLRQSEENWGNTLAAMKKLIEK